MSPWIKVLFQNKKVLLRDHNRCIARGVSTIALLPGGLPPSCSGGGIPCPVIGGTPYPVKSTPVLSRGYPLSCQEYSSPVQGIPHVLSGGGTPYPVKSTPVLSRGYPLSCQEYSSPVQGIPHVLSGGGYPCSPITGHVAGLLTGSVTGLGGTPNKGPGTRGWDITQEKNLGPETRGNPWAGQDEGQGYPLSTGTHLWQLNLPFYYTLGR